MQRKMISRKSFHLIEFNQMQISSGTGPNLSKQASNQMQKYAGTNQFDSLFAKIEKKTNKQTVKKEKCLEENFILPNKT